MRIVFIGAGNLATHLSLAMQNAGMDIVQVYSHTLGHARELADLLGCDFTNSMESIVGDADLYLFSVKDSVLPGLLKQLPRNKALWVHTAGSLPMDILSPFTSRYGVFYPLQTFSKNREVDFHIVPVFIEANSLQDESLLKSMAEKLTQKVVPLSSE